jgi:hypothetical protein
VRIELSAITAGNVLRIEFAVIVLGGLFVVFVLLNWIAQEIQWGLGALPRVSVGRAIAMSAVSVASWLAILIGFHVHARNAGVAAGLGFAITLLLISLLVLRLRWRSSGLGPVHPARVVLAVVISLGFGLSVGAHASPNTDRSSTHQAAHAQPSRHPVTGHAGPQHEGCAGPDWPQPVPSVVGDNLGDAETDLLDCFDLGTVTTADGDDVSAMANTLFWTIARSDPPQGTPVGVDQPINLVVAVSASDYLLDQVVSPSGPFPSCFGPVAHWTASGTTTQAEVSVTGPTTITVVATDHTGASVRASIKVASTEHGDHAITLAAEPASLADVLVSATTSESGLGGSCHAPRQ